jgi:PAS domain S-box-containing protein
LGWTSQATAMQALVLFVVVCAGHALGTEIVYRLSHVPAIGVTFFPASGVTVAALLVSPRRLWPVVLAATYASEFLSHVALGEAVVNWFGLSFADTVSPLVAASLVLAVLGTRPRLSQRRDLAVFVVCAGIGGPLVGALIGPEIARMHAVNGTYLATAARWATGDSLGVLIVGAFLLSWLTESRWPARPSHPIAEAAALSAAVVGIGWLAFWTSTPIYLVIPLLGWAALRFGVRGAATAGLAITALAEWAIIDGHHQFASIASSGAGDGWLLQLFLAVVILTALVLAAQVGELSDALASAQASEEQYRGIFDATGDGLVISDPHTGVVVEVNPAFAQMHGYDRDELIGARPAQFIHPDEHGLFTDFLDAVQHGLAYRGRARDVTKDGRVFDVEIRGRSLPFRGQPHLLSVVRDISEEAAAYRLLEARVDDRTRELSRLLGIAGQLAGVVKVGDIPEVLARQAPELISRSSFRVWVLENRQLTPIDEAEISVDLADVELTASALESATLLRCRGTSDEAAYQELTDSGLMPAGAEGVLAVPLMAAGGPLGVMVVARQAPPRYSAQEVELAQALGSQVAVALANATLFARSQSVAAGEARQGIARDLHDSVSQTLFSMTLHARAAQTALAAAGIGDGAPPAIALEEVAELTRGALAEMRALIFELRPGALAEEGLVTAVSKHAAALSARESIRVNVVGPTAPLPLDANVEEQLYRFIQEALYNVVKHAQTDTASVAISVDEEEIAVHISDEGVGFDPAVDHPGHVGLRSMGERASRLGGRLHIHSAPGGTTVTVTIPHPNLAVTR